MHWYWHWRGMHRLCIYKYGQQKIMYSVLYCARAAHWPIHPQSITKTLNIDRPVLLNPPASQESDWGNRSCELFSELKSRARSTCIVLYGDITHGPIYMLLSALPESFVLTCGHHLNLISSVSIKSPYLLYCRSDSSAKSNCDNYTVRQWYKCFPSFLFRYCQSIPVPVTAIIHSFREFHLHLFIIDLLCKNITEPESLESPASCYHLMQVAEDPAVRILVTCEEWR